MLFLRSSEEFFAKTSLPFQNKRGGCVFLCFFKSSRISMKHTVSASEGVRMILKLYNNIMDFCSRGDQREDHHDGCERSPHRRARAVHRRPGERTHRTYLGSELRWRYLEVCSPRRACKQVFQTQQRLLTFWAFSRNSYNSQIFESTVLFFVVFSVKRIYLRLSRRRDVGRRDWSLDVGM